MSQAELEPIERASVDELRTLQLERLRGSLRYAYDNVPHYRQAFGAANVHPDDLRELADLARFPFTTKQTLRDNYPFAMFAIPRERVTRIHASSGTTGKPTVVGYSRQDLDVWAALVARSIRAAGGKPGDLVHIAYGYGLFTGGLGAHYGAEQLGCTVIPMSGGQTERQVQLIVDFRPDIIMATPSYLLAIADEFKRERIDPRDTSLRLGILGAEPWTDSIRREIENTFGIDAVDIYGLSEVMGPGVATELVEEKSGAYIWEDHFYPEIIHPDSGAVLPDGEYGELVFTSLTKEAMPVVRFRTRDLTRLLPGRGRPMRRLDRITGRSDDMLIIRGVNVFPSQIEEQILKMEELAPHYQLEICREGHLDAMDVLVERRAGQFGLSAADRTRVQKELAHRIKSYVGISTRVRLVEPETLQRAMGKVRRIVDRRSRE